MSSVFSSAQYIPPDSIFEVTQRFLADTDPNKVNVGAGTYRDENAKPWILPSVRMAKELLSESGHEYLPISGLKTFRDTAVELALHGTRAFEEKRVSVSRYMAREDINEVDCFLSVAFWNRRPLACGPCFEKGQFQLQESTHY